MGRSWKDAACQSRPWSKCSQCGRVIVNNFIIFVTSIYNIWYILTLLDKRYFWWTNNDEWWTKFTFFGIGPRMSVKIITSWRSKMKKKRWKWKKLKCLKVAKKNKTTFLFFTKLIFQLPSTKVVQNWILHLESPSKHFWKPWYFWNENLNFSKLKICKMDEVFKSALLPYERTIWQMNK